MGKNRRGRQGSGEKSQQMKQWGEGKKKWSREGMMAEGVRDAGSKGVHREREREREGREGRREDKRSIVLCGSPWLLFSSVATTTAREETDKLTRWLETRREEAERLCVRVQTERVQGCFRIFRSLRWRRIKSDGSHLYINFSSLCRQGKSTCEDQRTRFVLFSPTLCSTFLAHYLGFSPPQPHTLFAYFPSSFPSHTLLQAFKGWQQITVKNFTVTPLDPGSKHVSVLPLIYCAFNKQFIWIYRIKAQQWFV